METVEEEEEEVSLDTVGTVMSLARLDFSNSFFASSTFSSTGSFSILLVAVVGALFFVSDAASAS